MATIFHEEIIFQYKNLYETKVGYDVKIYAGENQNLKEFYVHSFVLKAQSEFFKATFEKDVQMKDGYFILKSNNSPEIFEILLRYMYYGNIDITKLKPHDMLDLVLSSDELGLHPLVTYVQEILINLHRKFIIENIIEIIELIYQTKSCDKLWDLCLRQICDNPDYLFNCPKFLSFDPTILESLLKRDDLNVSNEIVIWENLLKWACEQNPIIQQDINEWDKNDFTVIERRLNRFIPLIRFYYISIEDFRSKVYPFKALLPNDLLNDVLAYYNAPNKLIINKQLPRCASTLIKSQHFAIFSSLIDKKGSFHYKFSHIPYDFKLLYRASRDGKSITAFHEACDNKGATIVIAKIEGSEEVVGGYNPLEWNTSGSWGSTKDSFLFSFKNRMNIHSLKIGYSKGDEYSIHCGLGYGPFFGIGIDLGCNSDGTWISNTSTSYTKINIPSNFIVDDYEVFQIIKK
ncbi:hypothetical protein RclHR1_01040012 [Rhizophagus clarus]|uniref:BTB/POZ domain-containing protein n=1 Tax=Rhizophagus clarus TaxID=94130 RepID=A0A2Z6Q1Q3_9GLOM|nr:hypothetical protein RclHR1_01040012 [Rhizophagus clarus]GES77889.1 BTB/POZ domain-containing protein [Rhizophagus clarus]